MAYNRSLIYVLIAMLSMAAAPAFSADAVFDTATASKHLEQGISYLKANDFDAAISEFNEAASVDPEAESFYFLGYAYYMKGRTSDGENRQKALEYFDQAYELDPNFSPTSFKLSVPSPEQAAAPPPAVEPVEPPPAAEPVAPPPAEPQDQAPEQPNP